VASPLPEYTSLIALALSALGTGYNVFFAPSRADRRELDKLVSGLVLDGAQQEARLAGFGQRLDQVAEETARRCQRIEAQLSEVSRIREDLSALKAEMKHVSEGTTKLETKLDRIIEALRK
jgi:septal ring factor EnvC (AmiA/AmiB activator)